MYYLARVEVAKAVCHIPQLRHPRLRRDYEDRNEHGTHQANTINLWVLSHVFGDLTVFHPATNDLERLWYLGGDSEERDDVGMS
jgi:hypothetical protein